MPDRGKVIKGLNCCCGTGMCFHGCPYHDASKKITECTSQLALEALDLLKEQEPKRGRWIEDDYIIICSECREPAMQRVFYSLTYHTTDIKMIKTPYCPNCGARMERSENDD